jgi:hypothetical protein
MSVELFKKRNDGLEKLSVSPCSKRQKWRESYLGVSERVAQKLSVLVERCTYKSCSGTTLGFNDYGWKSGTPIE